jgi:hypothetical protein
LPAAIKLYLFHKALHRESERTPKKPMTDEELGEQIEEEAGELELSWKVSEKQARSLRKAFQVPKKVKRHPAPQHGTQVPAVKEAEP